MTHIANMHMAYIFFSKAIPERSAQGGTQRESGHVFGFLKSPVVGCKRSCQSHLTQSSDKVGTPEEQKDVVELKDDQVFVIRRFTTIESKQALRPRTVHLHLRKSEVLQGSEEMRNRDHSLTVKHEILLKYLKQDLIFPSSLLLYFYHTSTEFYSVSDM